MSTTTYCQPKDFRCSANHWALALKSGSVIVVPKESQLFQPIGGVGARVSALPEADDLGLIVSPFILEPFGVAEAKDASASRAISETRSSIRGFMAFLSWRIVRKTCKRFRVEIAQWGICYNQK